VKALIEGSGQAGVSQALAAFDQKAASLEGGGTAAGIRGGPGTPDTLTGIVGSLSSLMGLLQGADVGPTSQLIAAVADARKALASLLERWNGLKAQDLASLNAQLKAAALPEISIKE